MKTIPNFTESTPIEDVLIERCVHHCCKPNFETNFKKLFIHGDPFLLDSTQLSFLVNDEMDSQRKVTQFIEEISESAAKVSELA